MSDLANVRRDWSGQGALTGTATAAPTGTTVPVNVGGDVATCQVLRGVTIAAGDVVLVIRQGSARWVVGRLFAAAPPATADDPPDPAPVTKPVTRTGSTVIRPVSTGSYRSGAWRTDTDDVIQGVVAGFGENVGAAFYGKKPAALAGVTVTRASIRVRRIRGGIIAAQATTLRLVTQKFRPAGAPTRTLSTAGPIIKVGATFPFTIPTSWAQAMVDGTAGGLALDASGPTPYVRTAGRSTYAPAWTLTIDWTR